MQYLVKVSGDVANKQDKAYVINSESEKQAKELAIQNFCEEFKADTETVYVKSDRRLKKAIIAFILMLIPIFLSFINWKNGHDTISIKPDYISTLYGVLIYAAFVVRFKGVHRTVSSWVDILFCVFNVLLLATFVKTILFTKTLSIFGLITFDISTSILLPVAIILSWLGLKVVSLICMAGIGVMALFNITALNAAMGFICGPLYIICSFLGMLLYLSVEPAFLETVHQMGNTVVKSINYLNKDVAIAKENIKNIKGQAQNKLTKGNDEEDK